MLKTVGLTSAAFAAGLMFMTPASAQEGTVSGIVGGAATGAIIGGPPGAVVGGIAGGFLGTAIDPPPAQVRTYVMQHQVPSYTVAEPIAVGQPLPRHVALYPVPNQPYYYTVVNHQRVIVDPHTRGVVEVVY